MNAQTTHDIEPAVLEVKYDVRQGVNKDLYCLRCGKKVSEYFSLNRLRNDSLIASADPALNMIVLNEMLEEAQHKNNPDKRRAASPGNNEYLYTNLKEGKISVYTSLMGTRYVTEEAIPIMEWSIMEDSAKNVCGYECHKATTTFRGRTWEVWYTDDVPVSAGPWKFGGLPGLIMKIHDVDSLYVFEAIAIEKGEFPIWQYPKEEFMKSNRTHTWKLQIAFNRNYRKTAGIRDFNPDGTVGDLQSSPHDYDPMELE
jgi:GLPGLI family protein